MAAQKAVEAKVVRKAGAKASNFAKAGEYMENNLIKVFDSNKANQLADLGFRYTLDRINNQEVYAFFVSKELIDYLNSNFDAKDYFMNNTLHF